MFDFTKWLMEGIIDGYKKQDVPFCVTTDRTKNYLEKGFLTQEQAIEIAERCPAPAESSEEEIELLVDNI